MSDYTRVDYAHMQEAQRDLQTHHAALVEEIDSLESKLLTQLESWEGDTQAAYYAAKAEWDAAMAHMQEVMQRTGVVVGQVSANYAANDAATAARFPG